jgi:hypothetical protein
MARAISLLQQKNTPQMIKIAAAIRAEMAG